MFGSYRGSCCSCPGEHVACQYAVFLGLFGVMDQGYHLSAAGAVSRYECFEAEVARECPYAPEQDDRSR